MSDESQIDTGVLAVLAKEFTEQRIPVLMAIKEKVDRGEVLEPHEFDQLARMLEDAGQAMPLAANNPDWHKLAAQVARFFHQITEKALENEERAGAR